MLDHKLETFLPDVSSPLRKNNVYDKDSWINMCRSQKHTHTP